ncbi:tetratricopeptide repeat protein [Mangrovimonas spongiae]|uniref:Tetratricopeptide repeat protein n=1 Tax=Mangrovimonas spongiae TaxID=2494697 RepID=A0A3R9N5U9_9FLAO|nr:tetratricopeptide repeat protein [Mangrovimonas spongiae]RSK39689.1 tetratricopeptide repeat protein [Mangrovimonas spongiae]
MRYFIVFICLLFCDLSLAQQDLSSLEALKKFRELRHKMNKNFPEDDIRTYRRASFTESQLQNYLSQHFQSMDLLPLIEGEYKLKTDSYLHSGNWFYNIGFAEQSINAYKDFFKYYKTHKKYLPINEKDHYIEMQNFAYSIMAENYAKLGKLDSAATTHLANINFSKMYEGIYYPSALNNYGLFFYWVKNDFNQALYYFNKAYEITQIKMPNHSLNGSIRDNIADIYYDQKEYELALPLYQKNFRFYETTPNVKTKRIDVTRLISAGNQLITTNIKLHNIDDANKTYKKLLQLIDTHNQNLAITSKLEFLKTKEMLLNAKGDIKEAYAISKNILKLSDSLNDVANKTDNKWVTELNNRIIDRVSLSFKIDQIQKENKIKRQRLKLWVFALIFSIIIILLASLFIRRRQHIINAKNKQLLAEKTLENTTLKVKQLNSEIKSRERDLSDFAINLSQNQEWIELLGHKIEALKEAGKKEKKQLLEELEQDIHNKVSFDTNTKDFFERLDKLSDLFYSKLGEKFPNLSKNDIRLCSLIRLKIDSRSIATLQNITLASLNTSRYRLRKKLKLSEDDDLDTFIQNL